MATVLVMSKSRGWAILHIPTGKYVYYTTLSVCHDLVRKAHTSVPKWKMFRAYRSAFRTRYVREHSLIIPENKYIFWLFLSQDEALKYKGDIFVVSSKREARGWLASPYMQMHLLEDINHDLWCVADEQLIFGTPYRTLAILKQSNLTDEFTVIKVPLPPTY